MLIHRFTRSWAIGLALLLLAAIVVIPASAQNTASSWQEDLTMVGGDVVNVVSTANGLELGDQAYQQGTDSARRYGVYTLPLHTLERPVNQVRARLQAQTPAGAEVLLDVRVRTIGGSWTEWTPVTAKGAALPRGGEEVQARLTLLDDGRGHAPLVRSLQFSATLVGDAAPITAQAALIYTIYATREGLVGSTTANGHVITSNDHFVALPSRRALASNGGSEYQVRLSYSRTGKSVTVPVWDVGPWNTKDDYWNPSSTREMFSSLPQGKPEAQAAYQDGFNGGKDQFGRTVGNPAGIDLADGVFWSDLGMTDNDWIQVTYLWTTDGSATWETIVDNASSGYVASSNWGTSSSSSGKYGTDYRYATPSTLTDGSWFSASIPTTGSYEIYVWYPISSAYNSATQFVVQTPSGLSSKIVDQRVNGGKWVSLGIYTLGAGSGRVLGVSRNTSGTGYVVADAVRIVQR